MLRVLQINAGETYGGVSAMVYHIYQYFDRSKVQFDFVAPNVTSYYPYRDEIVQSGGRIFELKATGSLFIRKLRYWTRLYRHIRKYRYRVIHINSGSVMFNLQTAVIARLAGVRRIIVHSHNAGNATARMKSLMPLTKKMVTWAATDYLACSHKAAEYMFDKKVYSGKRYKLILNGIDAEMHKFSQSARDSIREQYDLGSRKVLLHVGRFNIQKNHKRLVRIFSEYLKREPEAVLMLVGEGELFDDVKALVKQKKLENNVLFLGLRKDVPELMSAADVFVLPSLYEGLPVVGIEAQCSGLPCVFSSEITTETDISRRSRFVALEADDKEWADAIDSALDTEYDRNDAKSDIVSSGYTIQATARIMERLYLS